MHRAATASTAALSCFHTQRSGMNTDPLALARFAEEALLSVNRRKEAFNTYALLANQAQSHIGTYRALAKKYPELDPKKLFAHLVAAHPPRVRTGVCAGSRVLGCNGSWL